MGETIKRVNFNELKGFSSKEVLKNTNYNSNKIAQIDYSEKLDGTTNLQLKEDNTTNDTLEYSTVISSGLDSVITQDWTNNTIKELQEANIDLSNYINSLDELPLFYIYLKNVEDTPAYTNLSLEEKLSIAQKIQKQDLDLKIAHNTPMLKHGKVDTKINPANPDIFSESFEYEGDYLQFYNEYGVQVIAPLSEIAADTDGNIYSRNDFTGEYRERYIKTMTKYYSDVMIQNKKYSEKFKNQTMNNLKTICLANIQDKNNFDSSEWAAYVATNEIELLKVSSNMIIDTNNIMDVGQPDYNFMIDVFTHELGHVFANASSIGFANDIDKSAFWTIVYSQLKQYANDQTGPLREYDLTNPSETFAECVTGYFGGVSGDLNPNDLKVVEVDIFGTKISLYDIMSSILDD